MSEKLEYNNPNLDSKENKKSLLDLKEEIKNSFKNRYEGVKRIRNIEIGSNDFLNFTAMIKAEAGGEGLEGMIAVGYAIINRMILWKQSMSSVLFEKGQFSPVLDGRFKQEKRKLTQEDKDIAENILKMNYQNPIGNATFFQTVAAEKGSWQSKTPTLTKPIRIGNHIFRTEKRFLGRI